MASSVAEAASRATPAPGRDGLAVALTLCGLSIMAGATIGWLDWDVVPAHERWFAARLVLIAALICSASAMMSVLRGRLGLGLAVALVIVGIGLALGFGPIDDAYVFFRYVRNIHEGHGVVFNPGERVEGYSSPLWLLVLYGASLVFGVRSTPLLATIIGVALCGLAVFCWQRLVQRLHASTNRPGVAALVCSASFPLVFWAFSGMEVGLHLALLLAGVGAFVRLIDEPERARWIVLSSTMLTLAVLTRPESVVLLAAHLPWLVAPARRGRAKRLGLFLVAPLVLCGALLAWRLSYFGAALPNTYYAKVGALLSHTRYALGYVVGGIVPLTWMLLWLPRAMASRCAPRRKLYYLATLLPAQIAVIVLSGADHFGEWRFMLPVMFLLAALGAGALDRALDTIANALATAGAMRRILRSQLLALLCIASFVGQYVYDRRGPTSTIQRGHRLALHFADFGHWARNHLPRQATIATPVIGAIGYHSARPLLDMQGLTDRHIGRSAARTGAAYKDHQRYDADYVLSRRPAVLYLLGTWHDQNDFLRSRHWLPAIEDLKRRLPAPDYVFRTIQVGQGTHSICLRKDLMPVMR